MLKYVVVLVVLLLISFKAFASENDIDDEEEDILKDDSKEQPIKVEPQEFVTPEAPPGSYFADFFPTKSFFGKWQVSLAKKDGIDEDIAKYSGEWSVSSPDKVVLNNDFCLIAKSKAHHHAISGKFNKPFSFKATKPLVVQYDVKFQNGLECGGAYVKLLSGEFVDLKNFNDKTPYTIMFGPDKCGTSTKVHFIIRFMNPKSKVILEHHAKQSGKQYDYVFTDNKSHLFTLVLNPDDSYIIYLDQSEITRGNIMEETTMQPPLVPAKEIDDPNDRKPKDWDEREEIPDAKAVKPDDWDESAAQQIEDASAKMPGDWLPDEPEYVPDEKAKKPDDWDEEMDGVWEPSLIKNPKCEKVSGCGKWKPPMIKNPAYKGKWSPPMIKNPAYQGKWRPRKIDNPDFFELTSAFNNLENIGAIGLELWTMSDGIAFDNFLVVDDKSVADAIAAVTWSPKMSAEARVDAKASVFSNLIQTANDKPWLWAVFLLVILIPIILITIFCFSGSKDKDAEAKKTDEPSPDVLDQDQFEDEGNVSGSEQLDDQDQQQEKQQQVNGEETPVAKDDSQKGAKGDHITENTSERKSPKKTARKADLEESSGEESEPKSFGNQQKESSGSPRRRSARKAD